MKVEKENIYVLLELSLKYLFYSTAGSFLPSIQYVKFRFNLFITEEISEKILIFYIV